MCHVRTDKYTCPVLVNIEFINYFNKFGLSRTGKRGNQTE